MKILVIVGSLLLSVGLSLAQQTQGFGASPNADIPDGNPVGYSSSIDVSSYAADDVITHISLNLNITGGYNGDLYAYLAGPGGGYAVLLNRTGVSSTDSFGYTDAGFNVIFNDSAPNGNIHFYQDTTIPVNGGQLNGSWAPDGENVDPTGSDVGSAPATAMLASFNGANPNGTWTLFVSDLSSGGGTSELVSWTMAITTVPEPQAWAMGAMGALLLMAGLKWRSKVG